ncbi:ATP-binding cassette domain-containing protein [Pseudonocardia xishanensis]|uniref:ABC transporter domain-containing protein n=1 Tax=Pseudonocardia xishanensis TaxID=630995 RepID=A0ABP8REU2_9PSEU
MVKHVPAVLTAKWPDVAVPRAVPVVAVVVAIVCAVPAPSLWNSAITLLLAATVAYPLALLARLTGIVSLASAPVALAGGVGAAYCSTVLGLPILVVLAVSAAGGALIGLLMSLPALRWSTLYTLVTTLAAVYIVVYLAARVGDAIGQSYGLTVTADEVFGVAVNSPQFMLAALGLLLVANVYLTVVLPRSQVGRDWQADRTSRHLAATLGVRHGRVLLASFMFTSALMALAAALSAYWIGFIEYQYYDVNMSIEYLTIVIVGGTASLWGPLAGSLVYVLLPAALAGLAFDLLGGSPTATQYGSNLGSTAFGALLIATLLMEPRGLAFLAERLRRTRSAAAPRAHPTPVPPDPTPDPTAETGGPALLTVRDLSVSYGAVGVLHGIDLRVAPGEIVGITGPAGSGKTSLLRALAGFTAAETVDVRATRMELDGVDLRPLPADRRARAGVAFVPERDKIVPSLSVRANLLLGVRSDRRSTATATERALDRFAELAPLLDKQAGLLSGGERQMLAIASAMVMDPRLLVIDELTLGLSPRKVEELVDVIHTLSADGLTVVVGEQDASVLGSLAGSVCLLRGDGTAVQGPAAELLDATALEAVLIGAAPVDATAPHPSRSA